MRLPRYHRLRRPLYRLEGGRCLACERLLFPTRLLCPSCGGDIEPFRFRGTGRVYSFSRMSQAPRGFGELAPYTVAMIELDEGPLVMAQLTDVDGLEISIGMAVEMVTRKIQEHAEHGYIVYGYKFRPLLRAGTPAAPETIEKVHV